MQLAFTRNLQDIRPVLRNPEAAGPEPIYWVFNKVSDQEWENLTVLTAGEYAGEFPKTFGHYHGTAVNETYKVISGEGVLILQKKHEENGVIIPDVVDEVLMVRASAGDQLVIPPQYGHSWSNIDLIPLILLDDWRAGHSPSDYEVQKNMQGMAYYLLQTPQGPVPEANPRYTNPPKPQWLTAAEFNTLKLI